MTLSALFAVFNAAALVLLGAELVAARKSRPQRALSSNATPYVAAVVASYAGSLFVVWYAAAHQSPWPLWRSHLPLPVVARTADRAQLVALAMLALAAIQSWALIAIYRRRVTRGVVVAGVVLLIAASLCEPALVSPDPYSYVADAFLGRAAYAPPATPFAGEFAVINDGLGTPLPPSPYGPLWIAIAQIVTGLAPALLWKLLLLRLLGALLFLAFLAGLAALRLPARLLAVAALNPGLMLQYVMNAHNDLFCAVCIVWAAVAVRKRSPAAAAGAIVIASLVKLPFALLGLPILAGVRPLAARWLWAVLIVLCAGALSWLGGGPAYIATLFHHLPYGGVADVLGIAAAIAALAVVVAGIASRKRVRAGVWLFPLMGSYPTPWYVVWGVGYALASRRALAYLLIWFPMASVLVDTMFMQVWTLEIVVPALALACAFGVIWRQRAQA